jgi:hypothetical protein
MHIVLFVPHPRTQRIGGDGKELTLVYFYSSDFLMLTFAAVLPNYSTVVSH